MTDDPVTATLRDPRFRGTLTQVSAEERLFRPFTDAVWREQMATMLSVFPDGCVMEYVPSGDRWEGATAPSGSTASSSPRSRRCDGCRSHWSSASRECSTSST